MLLPTAGSSKPELLCGDREASRLHDGDEHGDIVDISKCHGAKFLKVIGAKLDGVKDAPLYFHYRRNRTPCAAEKSTFRYAERRGIT